MTRTDASLVFGHCVASVRTQLENQKLEASLASMNAWQQCADAITLLSMRGVMSDNEAAHAKARLIGLVQIGTSRTT